MDNENVNNVPTVDNTVKEPEVVTDPVSTSEPAQPAMSESQPAVEEPAAPTQETPTTPVVGESVAPSPEPVNGPEPMGTTPPAAPSVNELKTTMPGDKPKKGKGLLICLIVVALVAVAAAVYFLVFKSASDNPTEIIKGSINEFYSDFHKVVTDIKDKKVDFDLTNDPVKVTGDIKLTGETLKDIGDNKLNFALGLDYKNKRAEVSGALVESGTNLFDINAYLLDNKMYYKTNDMANLYIGDEFNLDEELDLSSYEELTKQLNDIPLDDIDNAVKEVKDALIKSLNEKYMSKGNKTVKVNGKDVEVNTVTYTLTQESVKELTDNLSKELGNSDKFLETVAKLTGMEKETIKDSLTSLTEEETEKSDRKMEFVIYTTGKNNKFVGWCLQDDEGVLDYYRDDDNFYLTFTADGVKTFEIVSKKEKNVNNISVSVATESNKLEELITITVREFSDETIDLDYKLAVEGQEMSGTIKVTAKKESDKKVSGSMKFTIKMNVEGQSIDIGVEMNYTVEIGASVASVDTSKALDAENITQEDAIVFQNMMVKLQSSKLFQFISSLVGEDEPIYDTPSTGF